MLVIEGLGCVLDLIEKKHYLVKMKLDGTDYESKCPQSQQMQL